jgi:hypothetical protein
MTSNYTSGFDDLLAKNENRMNELLGAPSTSVLPTTKAAPIERKPQTAPDGEATIHTGAAAGVAFRLTTR